MVTRPASSGCSEAEEVLLLSAAAVRFVPVDRREALGVMDVLCGQSSVQDLRVRPRLGKPGRQSWVSRGPRQGAGGDRAARPAPPAPGSGVGGHGGECRARGQRRTPQASGEAESTLWSNGSENCGAGSGIPATERARGTHTVPGSIRKCSRQGKGPRQRGP